MARKLISVLIIVFIVGLAWSSVRLLGQYLSAREELAQLERDKSILEKRHRELVQTSESLLDPETLEKEARLRLNVQKEGEKTVLILPPPDQGLPKKEGDFFTDGILANPAKWFKFIFGSK